MLCIESRQAGASKIKRGKWIQGREGSGVRLNNSWSGPNVSTGRPVGSRVLEANSVGRADKLADRGETRFERVANGSGLAELDLEGCKFAAAG